MTSVSPGSVLQIMPYLIVHFAVTAALVILTVEGLTAAKFKPLIFSVLGFALPSIANIWIIMIFMTSACCLHNCLMKS
jgi:hypothetical protein